jgi:DNA-binding transcriptional MerR regulator
VSKTRDRAARYPILAVSRLTGIGIDTLRAWERRHQAVTPVRDDRGRMYTNADIARLRLLRGAVEHGHSIGRLAGLTDAELRNLAVAGEDATAVSEVASARRRRAHRRAADIRCRGHRPADQPARLCLAAARTAPGRVDAGACAGG